MLSHLSIALLFASFAESLGFNVPLAVTRHSAAKRGPCRSTTVRADEVSDWGVDNLFDMMEDADEKIGGLDAFLKQIKSKPTAIEFEQTMAAIEDGFDYSPVAFSCGEVVSTAEQNQGSAKIFSFAKLQKLNQKTTLELFGRYYREDVLKNADGADHGNIRNFMKTGWDGVAFPDGLALTAK